MKLSEVVAKYGFDKTDFELYVIRNNIPYKPTITGNMILDDSKVDDIVNKYREVLAKKEEEKAIAEMQEAIKRKAMAEMLITSGFNFDGYRIVKYSGYISGDDATTVERGSSFTDGGVRDKLMASLVKIRRNALLELKEAAYDLGCNAVIGVDFDYLTLDPQTASLTGGTTYQPYVFGVTANGNAVIIEKIED